MVRAKNEVHRHYQRSQERLLPVHLGTGCGTDALVTAAEHAGLACPVCPVSDRAGRRGWVCLFVCLFVCLLLQRLNLVIALLLVRQRQPSSLTDTAERTHCAELGAVCSLPSGLLAMIGKAVAKLESQPEVCCPAGCCRDGFDCKRGLDRASKQTSKLRGWQHSSCRF
jgi:hypothetical protein